jgi:hypothetical protein
VVQQIMNGTGILKVYLVQTRKFAYRLNFTRALAPEWVLEALRDLNPDVNVGFEARSQEYEDNWNDMINEIEKQEPTTFDESVNAEEEDDEVQIIGGDDRQTVVMQAIKSVEEAWNDKVIVKEEENTEDLKMGAPELPMPEQPKGLYMTRSGRISRPQDHLIETAYAVIHETYMHNFSEAIDDAIKATVECTYAMKALLFQKALEDKPEEAMKALREEVLKAVRIDIWSPVHPNNLTAEEQKLIIPQNCHP